MHKAAESSSLDSAATEADSSRYDQLLAMQLRSDDDFARSRAAWGRVARALSLALERYLGATHGVVEVTLDSPSEWDLKDQRECVVAVALADSFRPCAKFTLRLSVRYPLGIGGELRGAGSYSGGQRGVEETCLAFPPGEVPEPRGYDAVRSLPPVRVLTLTVTYEYRTDFDLPLVYLPCDQEAKDWPSWHSMAFQGITEEGEFDPRGHAPSAIEAVGAILVARVREQISETVHLRAKQREAPPSAPTWR